MDQCGACYSCDSVTYRYKLIVKNRVYSVNRVNDVPEQDYEPS
jgi:hypothetical protein